MSLLEVRKNLKARKPDFARQDSNKKKFKKKWRKPKGLHSKMRLRKSGHMKCPSVGYRAPREVRGF